MLQTSIARAHCAEPALPRWTLADFFSTYRFWAFFIAFLLVSFSAYGINMVMSNILLLSGLGSAHLTIFYGSTQVAWVIGAFIAFAVVGRRARTALIVPTVLFAIVILAGQWDPELFLSTGFLVLIGLLKGVVLTVFTFAGAIFLVGGRPSKLDFGCAFVLVSASLALSTTISPALAVLSTNDDPTGAKAMYGFLACLVVAALVLIPCNPLAFDDAPRVRHHPLQRQGRSPLTVGILTALPAIALIAMLWIVLPPLWYSDGYEPLYVLSTTEKTMVVLLAIVALAGIVYMATWTYRIHGECADAGASQRLLTPLAAVLVVLFVPLGLPILLMTLGDLLNDRARAIGTHRPVPIAWLLLFSMLLPPVAMAMIQRAANRALSND